MTSDSDMSSPAQAVAAAVDETEPCEVHEPAVTDSMPETPEPGQRDRQAVSEATDPGQDADVAGDGETAQAPDPSAKDEATDGQEAPPAEGRDQAVPFLGRLAMEAGFATAEQVDECLGEQMASRSEGRDPKPLGELLVAKGYMTADQVRHVVRAQQEKKNLAAARRPARRENTLVTFAAGETICREGADGGRDPFILLDGTVEICKYGVPVLVTDRKGTFIGDLCALLRCERVITVVAQTRCRLLRICEQDLMAYLHNDPSVSFRLTVSLAQRLVRTLTDHALDRAKTIECDESGGDSLATLRTDGDDRLWITGFSRNRPTFLNGYPITKPTLVSDQDTVQIGNHLVQVFADHPHRIEVDWDKGEGSGTPVEQPEVTSPPPPTSPAPSDMDFQGRRSIEAEVDALTDEPFGEPVASSVDKRIELLVRIEALELERMRLQAECEPGDDVQRELNRQRREAKHPPSLASLTDSLARLESRLAGQPVEPISPRMRRAYELAIRLKKILIERNKGTADLLRACATYTTAEPLYRVATKVGVAIDRLFGWAVYAMALRDATARRGPGNTTDPVEDDPATGDPATGDPATGDPAQGTSAEGGPAECEPTAGDPVDNASAEDESPDRDSVEGAQTPVAPSAGDTVEHLAAIRLAVDWELTAIEPKMIVEFWKVYEAIALALVGGVEKADEVYLRAFLRWGLLGCSPRFCEPAIVKALLLECVDELACFEPGLDDTPVFYADEWIEHVADGKAIGSPNDDLQFNHRGSPQWQADRAVRQRIGTQQRLVLYQQKLDRLRAATAGARQRQQQAQKRLALINPNDSEREAKTEALHAEMKRQAVAAGRTQRLAERLDGKIIPDLTAGLEAVERNLTACEATVEVADHVRNEVASIRKSCRLIDATSETFPPFALRGQYGRGQSDLNDRHTVSEALAAEEKRDPVIFCKSVTGMDQVVRDEAIRMAPTVVIAPCVGSVSVVVRPRGGADSGCIVVPRYFRRPGTRTQVLWQVMADFRYQTSRSAAVIDAMNSDTLAAAYAEVRWMYRKKAKAVRKKAAIRNGESELKNWRRHYQLYMKSAFNNGKMLFSACPALYERIVGKFIELPEGGRIMR